MSAPRLRHASSAVRVALLVMAANASAEPASGEAAVAEALFSEGVALLESGRAGEACPKLADSHRLDPGGGTVLALGLCREAEGRWASAWLAFREAIAFARRDGRVDREQRAAERLRVLEPQLSHIVIRVPAPRANVEITLDDANVPRSAWGSRIPVDPGAHRVTATAPARARWARVVRADSRGALLEVTVPELRPVRDSASRAARRRAERAPRRDPEGGAGPRTTAGYAALGSGIVALGLGAWLGVRAMDDLHEADRVCPGTTCADQRAVQLSEQARDEAALSTVVCIAGAVLSGGGVVLLVTPPGRGASGVGGASLVAHITVGGTP